MGLLRAAGWIAAAVGVLAACGGGGAGGDGAAGTGGTNLAPPGVAAIDAQALWRALLTGNRTWTVAGSGTDGASYSGSFTFAAGPGGTVAGAAKESAVVTVRIARDGAAPAVSTTTLLFDPGTGLVRSVRRDGDECMVPSSPQQPPASALLGQSGALHSGTIVRCSAAGSIVGSESTSWSYQQLDGVLLFCVDTLFQRAAASLQSLCAGLDANGAPTARGRLSTTSGGVVVTMR